MTETDAPNHALEDTDGAAPSGHTERLPDTIQPDTIQPDTIQPDTIQPDTQPDTQQDAPAPQLGVMVTSLDSQPHIQTPARDDTAAPNPVPVDGHVAPDSATGRDAAAPPPAQTRITRRQRIERGLLMLGIALVCALLFAPVALALLAALASLVTDGVATLVIIRLVKQGVFLQTGDAMTALSIASRVGFMAIGYLGLFCALMALMSGLLGRGRGRLFIIPGALLTASALVLFAAGIALCWPLVAPLIPLTSLRIAVLALAIYIALDTAMLAALLADTRQTRRLALHMRASASGSARRGARDARHDAPPAPPTLASGV